MTSDTHHKYVYDAHINSTFIASYDLFSEPLQAFDFSLTGSQILRNSQVLLNKYFSSTYNFGCKFSKTFSKPRHLYNPRFY